MNRRDGSRSLAVMVSLVAPIEEVCAEHMAHVHRAVLALSEGGLTIGEWLRILCPHGMRNAWVTVQWTDKQGGATWGLIRINDNGKAELSRVDTASGSREMEGERDLGLGGMAVMSVVLLVPVAYGLSSAEVWLHGLGRRQRCELPALPRRGQGGSPVADSLMEELADLLSRPGRPGAREEN